MGGEKYKQRFFLKELSQLYPEALFIKIIRDPRSCILSKFNKKRIRNKSNKDESMKSQKNPWTNKAKFFTRHAASWSAWYQTIDLQISKYIKRII